MISSFGSKIAEDLFHGVNSRHARKIPGELHAKIYRLLDQLNAAVELHDLNIPGGNKLEKLQGDLKTKWSLRINKQWRIIFEWEKGSATKIDIVDYH